MQQTPIAIFSYNRPQHVSRLLDSLERNAGLRYCDIYIYCDGSKGSADDEKVHASREVIRLRAKKLKARIIERTFNMGIDRSIVVGVSELCANYGKVIVLEDDLVVSPDFVAYMLQSLDRFRDDNNIYQVSGYMFPVKLRTLRDALFLPYTTAWGWATWQRAWEVYDWGCTGYKDFLADSAKCRLFNLDNSYNYSGMLEMVMKEEWGPWDIRFYYAVFMCGGMVLHPRRSLVWNGGFDGSGVHVANKHFGEISPERIRNVQLHNPIRFPEEIIVDGSDFRRIKRVIADIEQQSAGVVPWRNRIRCMIERFLYS
jgi:GT2 family glycosyltransferase